MTPRNRQDGIISCRVVERKRDGGRWVGRYSIILEYCFSLSLLISIPPCWQNLLLERRISNSLDGWGESHPRLKFMPRAAPKLGSVNEQEDFLGLIISQTCC